MSKRIRILPYAFVDPRNAGGEIERYVRARFAEKYQDLVQDVKIKLFDAYHVRVYVNQPKKTLPDEVFEFAFQVADELLDKGYDASVIFRYPTIPKPQTTDG